MSRLVSALLLAASLSLAGCPLSTSVDESGSSGGTGGDEQTSNDTVTIEQVEAPLEHSDTADIVERALPSIVNIKVTALQGGFLGPQERKGQGSGVVVDRSGIILTNSHVVANATKVRVIFGETEREPLRGTVVGIDEERDLAVVKGDATDLNPLEIGSSAALELGDDVVALGYPLGLGGVTVTKGILSAEDRTIEVRDPLGDTVKFSQLLQTDAAINPGNSGGALIDANGRLVAINSAAAPAAAAENIGFAIPIDSALPVLREILNEPVEERAWLGVSAGDPAPEVLDQFGLDTDIEGAVVFEVLSRSPADKAGIAEGEVITSIDGEAIADAKDLIETLAERDPGDVVELEVVDDEGEDVLTVRLAQRPASFEND